QLARRPAAARPLPDSRGGLLHHSAVALCGPRRARTRSTAAHTPWPANISASGALPWPAPCSSARHDLVLRKAGRSPRLRDPACCRQRPEVRVRDRRFGGTDDAPVRFAERADRELPPRAIALDGARLATA